MSKPGFLGDPLPSQLPKQEGEVMHALLGMLSFWVNEKKKLVPDFSSPEDFFDIEGQDRHNLLEVAFGNDGKYIDDFVRKNPYDLPENDLQLVAQWKHAVSGRFILLQHKREHSLLYAFDEDTQKNFDGEAVVLGFKSLVTPFEHFFPKNTLPIVIITRLLPWKDCITYDTVFGNLNIHLGSGIKRSLKESSGEAIAKYGVVTSLPFDPNRVERDEDQELLKHYLSTATNRAAYSEEINILLRNRNDLYGLYYSEMGRAHARYHKKLLKHIGVKGLWYACASETILASAKKEKDLHAQMKALYPQLAPDSYHVFKV